MFYVYSEVNDIVPYISKVKMRIMVNLGGKYSKISFFKELHNESYTGGYEWFQSLFQFVVPQSLSMVISAINDYEFF
jgi:hypothetical protein